MSSSSTFIIDIFTELRSVESLIPFSAMARSAIEFNSVCERARAVAVPVEAATPMRAIFCTCNSNIAIRNRTKDFKSSSNMTAAATSKEAATRSLNFL